MKSKRILLYIVFLMSLGCNFLCIIPYHQLISKKIQKLVTPDDYKHLQGNISDSAYIKLVVAKSMRMDGSNYCTKEFHGLFSDLKSIKDKSHNETLCNPFNIGYLYAGLSYYAISHRECKDTLVAYLEKVSERYENANHSALSYSIENVVQVPFGLMFINLYKLTKNKKYLNLSKYIFTQLLKLRTVGGQEIPYVVNTDFRYVDGLGMIVPFLMEYSKLTGDTLAQSIAKYNIELIQKYCVDKETGIPHHGYNPKTHLKLGSANWGRGIGWYLLALSFYPDLIEQKTIESISTMDYSQFPGQPYSIFDTSTALMFEIFKQSQDAKRKPNIEQFKSHTTISGMLDDCSGDTYSYNDYSHTMCKSEMCNGFLLMLVSNFSNSSN